MTMLDGLRDVFKQALRFCHNEISYNFLVKRWNEECEEVYKYKQALIAEERAKHKPTADAVREFAKFLIDKAENNVIRIGDLCDYVIEFNEMTEGKK